MAFSDSEIITGEPYGPWTELPEHPDLLASYAGSMVLPTFLDDRLSRANFDRIAEISGDVIAEDYRAMLLASRRTIMTRLLAPNTESHLIIDESALGDLPLYPPATMLIGIEALRGVIIDPANNTTVHILPTKADRDARARAAVVDAGNYIIIDHEGKRRIATVNGRRELDPDESAYRDIQRSFTVQTSVSWTGARALGLLDHWQEYLEGQT